MNPETLSAFAGSLLSLLFNYFPGLNTAFDRLAPNLQRLVMSFLLLISSIILALWTCTDQTATNTTFPTCFSSLNWRQVIQSFVFALMSNQATDRISPKSHVS